MRTAGLRWKRTGPQIMLSTEQRKYNNTVHPKDTAVALFIYYTVTGSRHTWRNKNNNIAQIKKNIYLTLLWCHLFYFAFNAWVCYSNLNFFSYSWRKHEGNKYDGRDITRVERRGARSPGYAWFALEKSLNYACLHSKKQKTTTKKSVKEPE